MRDKPCVLEEVYGCNNIGDVGSLRGCKVAGEAAVDVYGVKDQEGKQCYCY